jgi:hypothetical protein
MPHVPNTTPYQWPFDERITASQTALVISVDDVSVCDDPNVVRNLDSLRAMCAACQIVVFIVDHQPICDRRRHGQTHRLNEFAARPDEVSVRSGGIDGFFASPLEAMLHERRITHLLLAGIGLETNVHSTLRSANDRGWECLCIVDACSCIEPSLQNASRSTIEMSGGIFGAVGHTADVLAAYAHVIATSSSAHTDSTREIS